MTLTAATPSIVMGIGLGTVADSLCTLLPGASTNAQPGAAAQLAGIVSTGTLCADVYDVGNQTTPVSYTLTVTHP